ncbi:MAG: hypothetical protein ABI655_05120 [Phenylobacterium sp.]
MNLRLTLMIAVALTLLTASCLLYWKGRREGVAQERPKAEAAVAKAAVAGLETEGARGSAQRVEVVVRQREAATRTVADVTAQALQSEDAHAALDPDRAARLRDADRQLCVAGPELAGCAADRDPG